MVFHLLQTIARLIQRLNTAAGKLGHTIILLVPVENISSALTCNEVLDYKAQVRYWKKKALVKLVSCGGSTFVHSEYTKSFLLSMLLNRQYLNIQYITILSPLNSTGKLFTRTVQPGLAATMRGTLKEHQGTVTDCLGR